MLAWLLSGDDIEEVDVDVDSVLILPDDKLYRLIEMIAAYTRTGVEYEDVS
jgi:hypothetical protein